MENRNGKIYLTVPHEGKTFEIEPSLFKRNLRDRGSGYSEISERIDEAGLKRPNSSETASLVYHAFQNPEGEYEKEIIDTLNKNWFWEYTGNLFLPKSNKEINNGVILDLNPKTLTYTSFAMDKKSLIKRLQENDKTVKFIPFGFKIGEQSSLELAKNSYIIARYGEEGAEKIAKISEKYKGKSLLGIPNSVDEEKISLSSLASRQDLYIKNKVYHQNKGLEIGNELSRCGGRSFGIVDKK